MDEHALYHTLYSWENLLLAYQKASAGKRGRPSVAAFEHQLETNLLHLQADLADESYTPGKYHSFYIHEPKRRLISAAPFRDRVVHHALCNLIEPRFERSFIYDSYANRVGKGTHRALDRCQQFARRYPYVLQLDIKQFFPSIDHQRLRHTLARKIYNPAVMRLIDKILASGVGVLAEEYDMVWFEGDDLLAALRPRGLPIGNLTSQFWANCYLNHLDHFIKRELGCRAYIRYVDDLLLFSQRKAQLWHWRAAINQRLSQWRLVAHPHSQPNPSTAGIPFLGFRVFPTHRRLKARRGFFYVHKLRTMRAAVRARQITWEQVTASVRGWVNHLRYGDTWGLRVVVLQS